MEFKDIRNESGLEFTDISSEEYRVYQYIGKDNELVSLQYKEPIALHVSSSGGHRLITSDGYCHYIKPEWISISWKVKEGKPHFVK